MKTASNFSVLGCTAATVTTTIPITVNVADTDGTPEAARRLTRVLHNDPATGVMRHAEAGYDLALQCARENNLDLPMLTP